MPGNEDGCVATTMGDDAVRVGGDDDDNEGDAAVVMATDDDADN